MRDSENNLTRKIEGLFLILILLGLIFCFIKSVKAQTESSNLRILYQGILTNSDGTPVADGRYNIKFGIYGSEKGGNVLWEEQYALYDSVFVREGNFKIILGRKNAIELNLSQPFFWLGLTVGKQSETGEIFWDKEMNPRKKIISLSELLKEEGLQSLEENGITESEWQTIFQLLEKKLGENKNLVVLFDAEQLKNGTIGNAGSKLYDVLQNLINFISEKISEILTEISQIRERVEKISIKLDGIVSLLAEIKFKIDALYSVLIVDKGLVPDTNANPFEEINYKRQKVERMLFKGGETSLRIFNQSINEESLIFVSFLDDPGSSWWVSERIPGHSFTISLKEAALQDLRFDYWILDEEQNGNQANSTTSPQENNQEQLPPIEQPTTTAEEATTTTTTEESPIEQPTIETEAEAEAEATTEESPVEQPIQQENPSL